MRELAGWVWNYKSMAHTRETVLFLLIYRHITLMKLTAHHVLKDM